MATEHTVKQGEHMSSIAKQYGFANYKTIWEDPANKALRELRLNPNVLFPGDIVNIPDKQEKQDSGSTERRHTFQLDASKLKLRIRVRNAEDEPITNTACELKIDGQVIPKTTNGEGLVEHEIAKDAKGGELTILDLKIPIKIGDLDPVEKPSGWRARLNNLGYNAGKSDDPADPQLKSAVEEFQCDQNLTVDGICGAQTQKKLKAVHGADLDQIEAK